ncbi:MAG: rhodanese-like domain-containing protein [Thermoplasmataceae archaeon]|jgi:rhodanese-related sulfurtransferase|nr:MAG: rhodanese-related sulfurtransferase [Thermoplasmatales archaeon E-plasma]
MSILDFFRDPVELKELEPDEIEKMKEDQSIAIIDVRTRMEYNAGHIEGIKNIPLGELKHHLKEFEGEKQYILVCATGHRSRAAANKMVRNNIKNVSHLKSGMRAWKSSGKNIVKD